MAPNPLKIARTLSLPLEAQTQTFAILAIRGVGKTYACLKMAEQMHEHALQFVFVDPTGVAWGLRSSADGTSPGLPVVIFGGERGDVPLEENGGRTVADFVIDEGVSCVLDLSDLRKAASVRLMTDFAERLYQRKARKRDPLHVFLVRDHLDQAEGERDEALDRTARLLRAVRVVADEIENRPSVNGHARAARLHAAQMLRDAILGL